MISVYLLVTLFIGASSSCTEHTNCLDCITNKSGPEICIYIGSNNLFACVNKLSAFDYDFDYLSEVTTDCDIDPGNKLKPLTQHIFNIKIAQALK